MAARDGSAKIAADQTIAVEIVNGKLVDIHAPGERQRRKKRKSAECGRPDVERPVVGEIQDPLPISLDPIGQKSGEQRQAHQHA